MYPSHTVKRGLSAAQRIQGLIRKCSFCAQGRGLLRLYQEYGSHCRILLLRCFLDPATGLYNTAVQCKQVSSAPKTTHNNLKTIFDILI